MLFIFSSAGSAPSMHICVHKKRAISNRDGMILPFYFELILTTIICIICLGERIWDNTPIGVKGIVCPWCFALCLPPRQTAEEQSAAFALIIKRSRVCACTSERAQIAPRWLVKRRAECNSPSGNACTAKEYNVSHSTDKLAVLDYGRAGHECGQ